MPGIINYNQIKQVVDIKSNASEFLYCYLNILKGVCFTVSIKFVVCVCADSMVTLGEPGGG